MNSPENENDHKLFHSDERLQKIIFWKLEPGTPGWDGPKLKYNLTEQGLRVAANLLGLPQEDQTNQARIQEIFRSQLSRPWPGSLVHFTGVHYLDMMRVIDRKSPSIQVILDTNP